MERTAKAVSATPMVQLEVAAKQRLCSHRRSGKEINHRKSPNELFTLLNSKGIALNDSEKNNRFNWQKFGNVAIECGHLVISLKAFDNPSGCTIAEKRIDGKLNYCHRRRIRVGRGSENGI